MSSALSDVVLTGEHYFCAPRWKSSSDFSRPAGDKPQEGDYLLEGRRAYLIRDVKHDHDGWNLHCYEVAKREGPPPWANAGPEVRVFDWNWRTS